MKGETMSTVRFKCSCLKRVDLEEPLEPYLDHPWRIVDPGCPVHGDHKDLFHKWAAGNSTNSTKEAD